MNITISQLIGTVGYFGDIHLSVELGNVVQVVVRPLGVKELALENFSGQSVATASLIGVNSVVNSSLDRFCMMSSWTALDQTYTRCCQYRGPGGD